MSDEIMSRRFIDELFGTIKSRQGGDPEKSYTAKLFAAGVENMARKIGEESTEVIVAALRETPAHVVSESADLMYHLMVLWAEQNITPDDVFEELASRAGKSGIEEKDSRDDE
ncbi:MAG: phosphoribosyl-ATP diphosphatase [Rhodospirillales bacterium]|nr:phosphoribosyl-ATP diphosphatase [Rhodospirillales bacterium]